MRPTYISFSHQSTLSSAKFRCRLLTYIATGRVMKDGNTENLISERKLLWDDENRLMAISDNGYVSSYRYDNVGNRTVKLSGYGEAVFINGDESGNGFNQTNRFTAYPNSFFTYNGSRYFKYIYVGSDRIVSKVSADNPDYDPRQVDCAGNSIKGYTVKLQAQHQALSDSIASIYNKFEVPYFGSNNDTYSYNWQDGIRRVAAANQEPDSYGELAYYYHSDHLGCTSYVTDANGAVSQHVEYVPFGEVFIEERNNTWNTPYLFNAKELDEETGLYYYGARYYDPRTSLWLSTDPMELKYPSISTYSYCVNNPIKNIDLEGESPFSALLKYAAKKGVKEGIQYYVKHNIRNRLQKYMTKDMLKQFANDADDIIGMLDDQWWEIGIELIPFVGDIYGTSAFAKKMTKVYNKLQDLENRYVEKIVNTLEKTKKEKFIKNMRNAGVRDARIDQVHNLEHVQGERYFPNNNIEGHHKNLVKDCKSKMSDPRNIEFMNKDKHKQVHRNNGTN